MTIVVGVFAVVLLVASFDDVVLVGDGGDPAVRFGFAAASSSLPRKRRAATGMSIHEK